MSNLTLMLTNIRRGHLSTVEVVKKVWKYATKQKKTVSQSQWDQCYLVQLTPESSLPCVNTKHEMDNKKIVH